MNVDDYENKIPYPERHRPIKPHLGVGANAVQAKEYAVALEKWEKENNEQKEKWHMLFMAHEEEGRRLFTKFKQDALKEFGLSDYPLKDKVFDFAWDLGHSAGHSEVWAYLQDVREIIMWPMPKKVEEK